MATMHNALFHGISGKIGSIVFRQRGGKTIVSHAPYKRKREKTENQKQHLIQFKLATIFAKTVMMEPELRKCYEGFAKKLKCPSAYSAAVKDYLKKPKIKNISVDNYQGCKGDVITITPEEIGKFYIARVLIANADGTVEEGTANYDPAETEFTYVAKKENYLYPATAVMVTLIDTPGHQAEEIMECWTTEQKENPL